MKILILEWKSYCIPDMINALQTAGHHVLSVSCPEMTDRTSLTFHQKLLEVLVKDSFDIIFTFNYFPVVSKSCNQLNIPYISWVYDNPLISLYSCSVINPCNYIFLFDYKEYEKFQSQGIKTIYYLPLCANPDRLATHIAPLKYASDVSFVGSLYNEPKHQLYERFHNLDMYSKGYLDALIFAQSRISGYFFLEEFLNSSLLDTLQKAYPVSPNPDGAETNAYTYSHYFLGRKATAIERHDLLQVLSEHFSVKVYTHDIPNDLPLVSYGGKIDYYNTMPAVFQQSKINLNITLKTIETGIPLRVWDIMGSGGFLLSNFQEELCHYFVPDEEFVYYSSISDAINKTHYYLTHEKKRIEIAHNGLEKIKQAHTFHHRVQNMFEIINLPH